MNEVDTSFGYRCFKVMKVIQFSLYVSPAICIPPFNNQRPPKDTHGLFRDFIPLS